MKYEKWSVIGNEEARGERSELEVRNYKKEKGSERIREQPV